MRRSVRRASRRLSTRRAFSGNTARMLRLRQMRGSTVKKYIAAGAFGVASAVLISQTLKIKASEKLHPANYPWNHRLPWQAFDHASIRRGHQVFNQVCATCHGLELLAFRQMVDVCYTEDEAKDIAADFDYPELDEDGYWSEDGRPGKLIDYYPNPYENDVQARVANNGAVPPDLSAIILARDGGEDYLFALLTGYKDPPAGVAVREGLSYNPYFPGGAIAMPQALQPEMVEFDDGTEGSISQMAKDVSVFLLWVGSPKTEDRKLGMLKAAFIGCLMILPWAYLKRHYWSTLKSQVVRLPVSGKQLYRVVNRTKSK